MQPKTRIDKVGRETDERSMFVFIRPHIGSHRKKRRSCFQLLLDLIQIDMENFIKMDW